VHSKTLVSTLLCAVALAGAGPAAATTVTTIAGAGSPAFPHPGRFGGDGHSALGAGLNRPSFVAPDPRGGYYIDDSANQRVRHVDRAGRIRTVAGNGTQGFCGDGGRAIHACLNMSHGLWPDDHGGLYIADTFNDRIRYVSRRGGIHTVASGISLPVSIRPAGRNRWLVSEAGGNRVLRYDSRTRRVSTVAGTGARGFAGDGGRARAALLDAPADAIAYRGGTLVADGGNCRLRWVSPRGGIREFAGGGLPVTACHQATSSFASPLPFGSTGDGHAATSARILVPGYMDTDGRSVYVTDFLGNTIRRIDARGVISTVAGSGERAGFNRERGRSTAVRLAWPSAVVVSGRRQLLITDAGNNRVRRISLSRQTNNKARRYGRALNKN
jgi:trimeric autotransporter adhesin